MIDSSQYSGGRLKHVRRSRRSRNIPFMGGRLLGKEAVDQIGSCIDGR
jgi:hypothetical protein